MPKRGSETSTVPVVWANLEFFGAIQTISCRDWWPWRKLSYITMTRRQSNNQWSGGIAAHPAPNNSECKNPLENFSPRFLGSRWHPLHWLFFKGPNNQRGVLLISSGASEGHLEENTPWKVQQSGLVLVRQCPGSPSTSNPEETGLPAIPFSWHPPYSPEMTRRTTTWYLDWKNNWKVAIFGPTWRSLLSRIRSLTDKFLNTFECLAKVRATGLEVYWASWGVCWINFGLGLCSLFLSWSG